MRRIASGRRRVEVRACTIFLSCLTSPACAQLDVLAVWCVTRRAKAQLQASLKEVRCLGALSLAVLDVLDLDWLHTATYQGWFCLARARYQMGAASVSQLQYDQNMSACVVLQPCTSDSESLESLAGSTLAFSTHSTHSLSATGSDAPTTWALHRVYEPEQDHASTLRRRKTASDATDAAASRTSSLGQLPAAPLRWFAGAMPPVVLKAAQQHFWRGADAMHPHASVIRVCSRILLSDVHGAALESVVDAANAQAKLRHLPVPVPAARQTAEDNAEPLSKSIAGEVDGGSEEVACILEKMGLHGGEAMSSEARAQQEGEGAEDEWTDTASAAIS